MRKAVEKKEKEIFTKNRKIWFMGSREDRYRLYHGHVIENQGDFILGKMISAFKGDSKEPVELLMETKRVHVDHNS